jgi:hypothetical protein
MREAVAWTIARPKTILAALSLFYGILGLWVLAPDAVYSGDIGVKYVQARALVQHRFASMDIPYPGSFLDEHEEFLPMRPPFIMATSGTTQAIFSPLSAVIQSVAVAAGGMRGLILLSILGAIATLAAVGWIAPPPFAVAVLIAVGLGSPLWFYAVSGWEHAPAVAFGTAAFALAAGRRGPGAAIAAGILLGTGAVLRDEVILLLPGMMAMLWWRERSVRPVAAMVAAVLLPLLLAAAVEVGWFHRPAAAHLRHAVHLVQRAAHMSDAPNPDVPALTPFTLRDRYETVVQYWLLGYGNSLVAGIFAAGLILALIVQHRTRSSLALLAWLLAVGALAAADLMEVVTAPKWVAGLHRVSPYLFFALMPVPAGASGYGWLRRAVFVTAAAYLIIAFAGVDTTGGKSLGPRLLLPLLPLLAVSAIIGIAGYLRAPGVTDRLVGVSGVALVCMAVIIQMFGCLPAYYTRNAGESRAMRAVVDTGDRLIVADDEFTAQLLLPLYYRRILLLADTPERSLRLGSRLAAAHLGSVLAVTRSSDTPLDLAPFKKRRTEKHGRLTLQFWER